MKLKLSKGILFIAIGLLFLLVRFYTLKEVAIGEQGGNLTLYQYMNFYRELPLFKYIVETIYNYIFAILFIILGAIEIIESGIFKKAGDDNAY